MECQINDVTFTMPASRSERARERSKRKRSITLLVRPLSASSTAALPFSAVRSFSRMLVRFLRYACAYGPWSVNAVRPVVLKPRASTLALSSRNEPPASHPEELSRVENLSDSNGGTDCKKNVKSDSIFADVDTCDPAYLRKHSGTVRPN